MDTQIQRDNENAIPVYLMNRHNDGLQLYGPDLLSSSRRYILAIEFSDGQLRYIQSGLSASEVPEIIQGLTCIIPHLTQISPAVIPIQAILLSNSDFTDNH